MKTKLFTIVTGVGLLLAAVPSSRTIRSRRNTMRRRPVKFTGTVTQMEWINGTRGSTSR